MSKDYPCVYWNDGKCKKFSDDKVTSWCVEGPCGDQLPSNADKIRAMTDEKLATFINRIVVCHHLRNEEHCEKCPIHHAKPCDTEGIVKWLQQPAEVSE